MINEKQVAYCGLFCPKCYKNVVSDAAQNLKNALENTHICGSKHEPDKKFKEALTKLVNLHCPKVCKERGGNHECKIRICCKSKTLNGCWECNQIEKCNFLTKQFLENLRKIKKDGLNILL